MLRRAAVSDLAAIMALENTVFPEDAWTAATMRAELADRHGYYLVAEALDGSGLVGYAGLRAPRGVEQADVQTIAVAEGVRRQGLGRALIGALLAEARDRGATEVFLEVRADNPGAQALYASLGFEGIAVRRGYYPGGVDALILRLVLPAPGVVPV